MISEPHFILASGSPRRRELLALGGWTFSILPAEIDESPQPLEDPQDYVLRIAEEKARVVADQVDPEAVVIAADTTVAEDGRILGKPADAAEAKAMLKDLRGRRHHVYTGLVVLRDGRSVRDLAATEVPMRAYTNEEIEAYIATGDPFDKAGAYAIQHAGFDPVEHMAGCYANVVGLPLCHLVRTLEKVGFGAKHEVAVACQEWLAYECPVYENVLRGQQ